MKDPYHQLSPFSHILRYFPSFSVTSALDIPNIKPYCQLVTLWMRGVGLVGFV